MKLTHDKIQQLILELESIGYPGKDKERKRKDEIEQTLTNGVYFLFISFFDNDFAYRHLFWLDSVVNNWPFIDICDERKLRASLKYTIGTINLITDPRWILDPEEKIKKDIERINKYFNGRQRIYFNDKAEEAFETYFDFGNGDNVYVTFQNGKPTDQPTIM